MLRFHHLRLAALAVPAYVVFHALQACTVTSTTTEAQQPDGAVSPDGGGASACPAGSVAKQAGSQSYCCIQDGGSYICSFGTEAKPGDPCSGSGTVPGSRITLSTDVCVIETCSGDRTCEEFPASTEEDQGTLVCTGGTYQWSGTFDSHLVTRACLTVDSVICGGDGYYGSDTIEPGAYYQDSYQDTYPYVCGYGSYYGVPSVNIRAIKVLSSTCTAAGASSTDCAVGDL